MLINSHGNANNDGKDWFRDENGIEIAVYVFACKSMHYIRIRFHRRFRTMQKAVNRKAKGRLLQRR